MTFLIDSLNFDIEDFDDEVVLVNFKTGIYYIIQENGVEIFRIFKEAFDLNSFESLLFLRLAVNEQESYKKFIKELIAEGILVQTEIIKPSLINDVNLNFKGNAQFNLKKFDDISALIKLDPIHEVNKQGWPNQK